MFFGYYRRPVQHRSWKVPVIHGLYWLSCTSNPLMTPVNSQPWDIFYPLFKITNNRNRTSVLPRTMQLVPPILSELLTNIGTPQQYVKKGGTGTIRYANIIRTTFHEVTSVQTHHTARTCAPSKLQELHRPHGRMWPSSVIRTAPGAAGRIHETDWLLV